MDEKLQVLKLMTSCKLVKGYAQSLIYDLQYNEFLRIPNELYDFLTNFEGKSLKEIESFYDNESLTILMSCINFLKERDIAFFCNKEDANNFPDLNLNWQTPSLLENFILDIDNESKHNYKQIIDNLSGLMLKVLQIRCFFEISFSLVEEIIDLIQKSDIRTVELIVKDNPQIKYADWESLIDNCVKITYLTIYSSREDQVIQHNQATLLYTVENTSSHHDCGVISQNNFACNMNHFCESQKHNTCLNQKASIDVKGEIRNCPSMSKSFGHYKNKSLRQIVTSEEFQAYWEINKDNVKVCRDCEYRYMCSDCRAYLMNPDDIYSQPAKCTYNPYIAKWKGDVG